MSILRRPKPQRSLKPGWTPRLTSHLLGEGHQLVHGVGVAGMEAAGDTGRADHGHQIGIVADVVGAEAFADVGVEIDLHGHAARMVEVRGC